MAYLARRAVRGVATHLKFDIVAGVYTPVELVGEPVATSIAAYAAWFPRLLESQNVSPEAIVSAVLELDFRVSRVSASIGFRNSSEMIADREAMR